MSSVKLIPKQPAVTAAITEVRVISEEVPEKVVIEMSVHEASIIRALIGRCNIFLLNKIWLELAILPDKSQYAEVLKLATNGATIDLNKFKDLLQQLENKE